MEHRLGGGSGGSSATESQITTIFSGGRREHMKRSPSELALEEFLNDNLILEPEPKPHQSFPQRQTTDDFLADFSFVYNNREIMNGFSNNKYDEESFPNKRLKIPATVDSQSSICGKGSTPSPISATNNPKSKRENAAVTATTTTTSTDSSAEQSDDEAGPCEQSNADPTDLKRIRRMVSNRESARRSRKRKQAHMADLQLQVDQLLGENASLCKQFTNVAQQYRAADTDNRVLKSDVEALRAKVKLAEDMVARGSLTCGLNQLLQSHLSTPRPMSSTHNLHQLPNVSPTITVHGDGGSASYAGTGSTIGLGNADINHGVISDAVSCVSDIWP